jgi:hypothetical protein
MRFVDFFIGLVYEVTAGTFFDKVATIQRNFAHLVLGKFFLFW